MLQSVQRHVVAALAILGSLGATPAPAAAVQRVIVVTPTAGDARIEDIRAAISFWRDTFADLALATPLVEAEVLVAPTSWRAIENYAWQISRLAGRLPDSAEGPPPPPEVLALDGDVVVLLSGQRLMPFARPLSESGRYLVAIPRARQIDEHSGADRNVVAHELGHTLGLRHGDDPTALMCEPCRTAARSHDAPFRPLSAADRSRLVELYGSRTQ
jgi:hypothetical protein